MQGLPRVSALTAGRMPQTADQKLLAARDECRRWVDAARRDGGPFWELLSAFVDDALTCGLRHHAYVNRVKNGLRYLAFLRDPKGEFTQREAFEPKTARAYQRYLSELRREERVQPAARPGEGGARPVRRAAKQNEARLDPDTQKMYAGVIRQLWQYALATDAEGFRELPLLDPTASLTWRTSHEKPREEIAFSLDALLATPFVRAKGRSLFEHERDLTMALVWAHVSSRNLEIREATWRGVQVWEVVAGKTKPLRTWPLEAALTGEVEIDDQRFVLVLTVGDVDGTKSDEHRRLPLVGVVRDRLLFYARVWVEHQLASLEYLRTRCRARLDDEMHASTRDLAEVELLIGGHRLSLAALRRDPKLWAIAPTLAGVGHVRIHGGPARRVDAQTAEAIRALLWGEIAAARYRNALTAFDAHTPIRDAFAGVVFCSREGGVLSDAQQQKIWRDKGWAAKGWTPQKLRANAVRTFENERLRVLGSLARVAGHRDPTTTLEHYASNDPWLQAEVCVVIQQGLLAGAYGPDRRRRGSSTSERGGSRRARRARHCVAA